MNTKLHYILLFITLFLIMCSQAQYIVTLQEENKLAYDYQEENLEYINYLESHNEILNNAIIEYNYTK